MIQYDIIAVKQLLYRDYGQDDTQAKPAPVPMADYTTSLRDSGIIAAKQLLYPSYGQDDAQAEPAPVPMANYTISLRDYGNSCKTVIMP